MMLTGPSFDRFAVYYKRGDIIFCEYEPGDTFYLIQEGRVQISKIMGGLEKTIDILKPGEIFGEMAILEEAPRSATAVALDDVKLLEFTKENFSLLLEGNPQIALKLLKLFIKRIYDQKRRLMILTLDDEQARIADVFLMLAESRLQEEEDEGKGLVFETTVDDIAHWAGMNPTRARNVLNQFASQHRVTLHPDKIVVHNINDFRRLVSSRRPIRK
ncbi:Crp/Fnr family transcriptional regulator [Spirochaeta thermophila]|uniref:Transcriptional regulator, Crp/Fnr family n=2 Tax=Winmispira thermophila TaxID=154 RepID=G0GA06_WINT7|nr:Crp/Fnr family transcriptional regulator [Spirochaeta thermophila]ADN01684.1 transcriptional regulatory protein [Spirochaeta thermophila DSM 6192]AEJ61694.1 putative transcriptional regulator, Crp/Fnr family [Spirochaeta thermophila DSM 6578]